MSFDFLGFCQHYGIDHTSEGHKHNRPGWIQVKCPFCIGNPGWHLGFQFEKDWFCCWRCGYHRTWDVLLALLQNDVKEAKTAMYNFKGRPVGRYRKSILANRILELPSGLQPLTARARRYLEGRKFNPDMLSAVWGIQSTGNIDAMKFRIFIPIFVDNKMVSWQCRDVTGKSEVKYIAQAEDKEIINNKDTLYGIDQATSKKCVVVEGVTDVWRLGPGSVATFGIKYKHSQVISLFKNFTEIHILFDPDPEAKRKAQELGRELAVMGARIKVWDMEDVDPGDLPQSEADAFMRKIEAGGY